MTDPAPAPLPIARRSAHILAFGTTMGCFWVGGNIVGLASPIDSRESPRFEWVAEWGATLGDSTISAMLSYAAVTLVLFGISLGGQATFEDQTHQERVRRSVGAIGALMAVSALVLLVFAIAATFIEPRAIPALVVVVPAAIVCWCLGIEIGRFVVADHRAQLDGTRRSLQRVESRQERLPRQAPRTWIANVSVYAHAAAFAVVITAILGVMVGTSWVIGAFTFVGLAAGLHLLVRLAAVSLVVEPLTKRLAIRSMAFVMYGLMITLVNVTMLASGLASFESLAFLSVAELIVPMLFATPSKRLPQALVDVSLGAALARICADDLGRQHRSLTGRVAQLERLESSARPRSLHDRVAAAARSFLT